MLPAKESLTVEFKSEQKRPQSHDEIVDNVVALANTEGGTLYLGIEDDGIVTGVCDEHRNINGLAALIFNKTVPQLPARVALLYENEVPIVSIEVDNSQQIVSTSQGKTLQRRLKADGSPEVVPLFVSQFISRLSQQRFYDFSAQPAPESRLDDLNPDSRNKLRSHIRSANAQNSLLSFTDEDFDRALELVVDGPYGLQPSVAGLLTIGSVDAIHRSVPAASAVFQVMKGMSPKVNMDPFVLPLVDMFDRVGELMEPWNPSHEVMSGLIRVDLPDFDRGAFREAMINAFCHRDYARMGSVRFLVDDDGLTIANPGGFIEGVSEDNLLTAQPRSRNPQLALILKAAGYVERTGRGVDTIYAGSIAAGGSFPDMVDVGGGGVPQAAISQDLVYDLKPYIDENNLQDAVGLNYTQHDQDGHIYAVHDQIESRGLWYNSSIFEKAGTSTDAFTDWNTFGDAMTKIADLGDDAYGYIAGQGSSYIVNAIMASTDAGKKMVESELTEETINSDEFANAFKTAAKLDQANGSQHTTDDNGNLMAEFNTNGKVGVLFNGVWNASGIDASLVDSIEPALFPGNVAIASAGGGLAVANNMSEEKTELALEFIKYMTSKEVQEKIFTEVQANPCNTTVDLNALAETSGDAATIKLAEACSQVNSADTVVINMNYTWGSDVNKAIINALMECAVEGTDIDARFESLQKELLALIG